MLKHYVGVTGITSAKEGTSVLNCFARAGFSMIGRHVPMVGVLISPRNLDPEWHSYRYAKFGDFPSIIKSCEKKCFLTLHVDAKSKDDWKGDFCKLLDNLPLEGVDGFQINVMHPEPSQLRDLRSKYPGKAIIFQYNKDFTSKDVSSAMQDMDKYEGLFDFVLIDPSRGRGEQIDMERSMEHRDALVARYGKLVGFAGGFNPENIEGIVESLVERIGTDFSIDVETGVRNEKEELDIGLVLEYLMATKSGMYAMIMDRTERM